MDLFPQNGHPRGIVSCDAMTSALLKSRSRPVSKGGSASTRLVVLCVALCALSYLFGQRQGQRGGRKAFEAALRAAEEAAPYRVSAQHALMPIRSSVSLWGLRGAPVFCTEYCGDLYVRAWEGKGE
jgi:hypothetical protein